MVEDNAGIFTFVATMDKRELRNTRPNDAGENALTALHSSNRIAALIAIVWTIM
jgi:hypothetical protein